MWKGGPVGQQCCSLLSSYAPQEVFELTIQLLALPAKGPTLPGS